MERKGTCISFPNVLIFYSIPVEAQQFNLANVRVLISYFFKRVCICHCILIRNARLRFCFGQFGCILKSEVVMLLMRFVSASQQIRPTYHERRMYFEYQKGNWGA